MGSIDIIKPQQEKRPRLIDWSNKYLDECGCRLAAKQIHENL